MNGCLIWDGARNSEGYGIIGRRRVHRMEWERVHGPIPEGLQIDHLCRNRACVNVAHMEVVDSRTNTLRGFGPSAKNANRTHCKNGHAFTPENTYRHGGRGRRPGRQCATCANARRRVRYYRALEGLK